MKVIKKFSNLYFLILFSLIALGSGVFADSTPPTNVSISGSVANVNGPVSLNDTWTLDGTQVRTINLNGYTITGSSDKRAIEVTGNANVTINGNSSVQDQIKSQGDSNAINISSGTVTLNNVNVSASGENSSCIRVGHDNPSLSSSLRVNGGSIKYTGSGLTSVALNIGEATVTLTDVEITSNIVDAVAAGGCVQVGRVMDFDSPTPLWTGNLNMTGGSINAVNCPNPALNILSGGVTLTDVAITSTINSPQDATVSVGFAGDPLSNDPAVDFLKNPAYGTLNMTGGSITLNTTGSNADGASALNIPNGNAILNGVKVSSTDPNAPCISVGSKTQNQNTGITITGGSSVTSSNAGIAAYSNSPYTTTGNINNCTIESSSSTVTTSDDLLYAGDGNIVVNIGQDNSYPTLKSNSNQVFDKNNSNSKINVDTAVTFPPSSPSDIDNKDAVVADAEFANGEAGSFIGPNPNAVEKEINGYAQKNNTTLTSPPQISLGGSPRPIPPEASNILTVSLGDQFLNYYKLAQNSSPVIMSQPYNASNLNLVISQQGNRTACINSLNWTVKSLGGSTTGVPAFDGSGSLKWTTNDSKQDVLSIPSADGNWAIQQVVTFNSNGTWTAGNTWLCYNGLGDITPGLYELTASAPNNSNISDSIRFIVTANTVDEVNIVKPSGQGNPLTFDINQTQSYDFEFETTPQDAPANVVEWELDLFGAPGQKAGDYAYVNPETGNVTFLQATPPNAYLELSVTVNGVPSSNNLIIQLTGGWEVEEGIAAYLNPVTVQSNEAYNLVSNIVATPTYVPIGNPEFLTFELTRETPGVILTPAGKLIPQNTNFSGVVEITAKYDDGEDSYTINFSVIFTPRAVAPTQVTAAPALNFVTGSQATQNVLASLLPKGSGSTPGTTTQVTSASFTYETSDPSVATVDTYGNVRPVNEGTATVTTTLIENSGITLVPPTGTTLAQAQAAQTQVTVTGTPEQVPATGITATPDEIYLAPASVNGGTHEQTVTVTVTPENTTDSVTAESGSTSVATVTDEGNNSFTVTAVSDGNTTITFTAGSAKAQIQVSVNSQDLISSGLSYSADSPDTFSITAGGVMVNPAIPSLEETPVENVTFMAWSGPDQGDMQTFTVNSSGNESFSSGTFTVNGNDRYFYNADNIFVEAYANNSQVYLGSLSPNYDWINTSTAGSSDKVAYITYQENNGFNTPTAFNGAISGVTGKNLQLEGIRVSSNIEGVDVVTDVHLQDLGWVEAVNDGVYAGTQHQARQMEAIRLRLVGDNALSYDIWAQGHVENTGWMQPVKLGNNIDFVGTTGKALQLEAVKIQIVPKGQTPTGWEAY